MSRRSGLLAGDRDRLELLEEVVALVVDQDEGREVFDADLVDGFHAEFRILDAFDALDAVTREHGSDAADGAEASVTTWVRLPLAIMTMEPPAAWNGSTYGSMRLAVVGPMEPQA